MKFLAQIFRYFYSTEITSSENQLRKDFGDFPPKPLNGDCQSGNFTIVRVRGIGEHIHFVVIMKRFIEGAGNEDTLSTTIKNQMPGGIAKFKRFGERKKIGYRVLLWILLGVLFIAKILKLIRMNQHGENIIGYFVPFRKDEFEIVINMRSVEKYGRDVASVITHEHIHLIQNKEKYITNYSREVSFSDEQLFTKTAQSNKILPRLKYILERHEVEARLNEIVVSFYRTHNNLPLSISGFFALLAASKKLGWLVSKSLTLSNVKIGSPFAEFVERDKIQAADLELVLLNMHVEHMLLFITEVLPVMYGNLLKYYGNDALSHNFMSQISRPNFYDRLYALPVTEPI